MVEAFAPVGPGKGTLLGGTGKLVGSGKRSLPMVCPFAIGKAFGLAAATRPLGRSRLRHR
jgi:hypothetical protein